MEILLVTGIRIGVALDFGPCDLQFVEDMIVTKYKRRIFYSVGSSLVFCSIYCNIQ